MKELKTVEDFSKHIRFYPWCRSMTFPLLVMRRYACVFFVVKLKTTKQFVDAAVEGLATSSDTELNKSNNKDALYAIKDQNLKKSIEFFIEEALDTKLIRLTYRGRKRKVTGFYFNDNKSAITIKS